MRSGSEVWGRTRPFSVQGTTHPPPTKHVPTWRQVILILKYPLTQCQSEKKKKANKLYNDSLIHMWRSDNRSSPSLKRSLTNTMHASKYMYIPLNIDNAICTLRVGRNYCKYYCVIKFLDISHNSTSSYSFCYRAYI